ncbi:MAG: AIR synthase-related protein [Bdellovibrionota bacterium]|nr:AIR synthase-related protein [Bdellovibrionota bacterium]
MNYRFEVVSKEQYEREKLKSSMQKDFSKLMLQSVLEGKIFNIESSEELTKQELQELKNELLHDPVTENIYVSTEDSDLNDNGYYSEILLRPGVTDNSGAGLKEALQILRPNCDFEVSSGKLFQIQTKEEISLEECLDFINEYFANPLLHIVNAYPAKQYLEKRSSLYHMPKVEKAKPVTGFYDLNQSDEKLLKWSKDNCWALDLTELKCIQTYFNDSKVLNQRKEKSLGQNLSDVEMEILAQTWSEHCKHKIFSANIEYTETDAGPFKKLSNLKVNGLFPDFIRSTTEELKKSGEADYLVSVFSDNAGIVRYDEKMDVCVKVETHNSPSALDPYGGALTGILGVNRDILGTGIGAKPIANMDVFCFADKSLPDRVGLPDRLLHPSRILEGVHLGVEDGGNKSGIPTINGSIHFDDSYAGKPLVYVGTIGALPPSTEHYPETHTKNQKPGDYIVVAGGRVGSDGIHGATFSSLALDENAPATAVQIGDPFTQKKLTDFLIEARNQGLYSSLTDNGAGGISSSIGEMAELTNGASIQLEKVPLKYAGLASFEIMISESQERMSFSVPPNKLESFLNLAKSFEVEACEIGNFTDTGFLEVSHHGECLAYLELEFMHNGLPKKNLKANFSVKENPFQAWHGKDFRKKLPKNTKELFMEVLSLPNIASKENLVRNYDHEVGAATFGKPFTGKNSDGPSDAGVIDMSAHGGSNNSLLAVSNGAQNLFAKHDAYYASIASVDECTRNLVATGADPEMLSILDNYCWPDPIPSNTNPDAQHKMAQLVRSCFALKEIALEYKAPLISGKDSMKNDFLGKHNGQDVKISVSPSLLVTGVAPLKEEHFTSTNFKNSGDSIYLIGEKLSDELYTSEFSRNFLADVDESIFPSFSLEENYNLYKVIHKYCGELKFSSLHDISEGGLFTALSESCFGGKLGAKLLISSKNLSLLFNEGLGRFIASIPQEDEAAFENSFAGHSFTKLGSVSEHYTLEFSDELLSLNELEKAWKETVNA